MLEQKWSYEKADERTPNQGTRLSFRDRSKSEFTMLRAKGQQKLSDDICDPGAKKQRFVITRIKKGKKSEL
jgi:hypothetical protein